MAKYDVLDNSNGSTNNEVALMSRKFKLVMKKKINFQHSSRRKDTRFKKKHKGESKEIICSECRKLGHMKTKCPELKKIRYSMDKKKKSLMVTWDNSNSEKSSNSNDEQANVCLMEDTNDKIEVKTCSEFDNSYSASLDDEKYMLCDVLLHKYYMISLQCKKNKAFVCENIELEKTNKDLKKKIQTPEESLSQASKIDISSTVEKKRERK
ncbi:hypothetical protein AAZX31_10G103200 [Glycine max]